MVAQTYWEAGQASCVCICPSHSKEGNLNRLLCHRSALPKGTSRPAWILIVFGLCTCVTPWRCVPRTVRGKKNPAWEGGGAFLRREMWPSSHQHPMEASTPAIYKFSNTLILTENIKPNTTMAVLNRKGQWPKQYLVGCGANGIWSRLGDCSEAHTSMHNAGLQRSFADWLMASLLFLHSLVHPHRIDWFSFV